MPPFRQTALRTFFPLPLVAFTVLPANADVLVDGANQGSSFTTSGNLTSSTATFLIDVDGTNGGAVNVSIGEGHTLRETDASTFIVRSGATLQTLDNQGIILGSAFNAINSSGTIDLLTNSGTIEGQVNGNAGLFSDGMIGTLTNTGTISHTGSSTALMVTKFNSITNTNLIESATGHGVIVGFGGTAAGGTFTNDGTIRTNGASGTEAVQLGSGADGDVIQTFNNSGTIRSDGAGTAFLVTENATLTNGLNNSGTIAAAGIALELNNTGAAFTINNSGTLDGDVRLGLNQLELNGETARITGTVAGTVDSSVFVNGTFTSENSFSVGHFEIATGGVFRMAHDVTAFSPTTFANQGTLEIASGDTVNISGNYTQTESGVFRTRVANDTTYGRLTVSGTATLPNNAKIDVDVTDPRFLFSTTSLDNVISAGTLSSDGTFTVTDNSQLFDFSAFKDGNTVDLQLSAAASVVESVERKGTPPATGAAEAIDEEILRDPNSSIATPFVPLTSDQAVADAVEQTLPSRLGNRAALEGVRWALDACTAAGFTPGHQTDACPENQQLWVKPFGSWSEQDTRDGVAGYEADSRGLVLGINGTLSPIHTLGLAFAYARADVDRQSGVAPVSSNADIYQLIGYGRYALDADTALEYRLGMGTTDNQHKRRLNFVNKTASASYDSRVALAGLGIRQHYPVNERTAFSTAVRADYSWIQDEAYAEKGAGAFSLNVDKRTSEELILGIEGKLSHSLTGALAAQANLGVGYDLLRDREAVTSAFAGAPALTFKTPDLEPSPWLARVGFSLKAALAQDLSLYVGYDATYREDFLNQTASLKATWVY